MILDVNLPTLEGKSVYQASIDYIIYRTCQKHNISIQKIVSSSRKEEHVLVRHKIVKQARAKGMTYQEIGQGLNRDHSSIMHLDKHYKPID